VIITTGAMSTILQCEAHSSRDGSKKAGRSGVHPLTRDGIAMAMSAGAGLARIASAAGGLSPTVPAAGVPKHQHFGRARRSTRLMIVDQ